MVKHYIPERGDIIFTDFSPRVGSEQSGKRPALVLSNKVINKLGFVLVCPITSKKKGLLLEVEIPKNQKISGVILPFHVRMIDWKTRNIIFIEKCPSNICSIVSNLINKMQGIN